MTPGLTAKRAAQHRVEIPARPFPSGGVLTVPAHAAGLVLVSADCPGEELEEGLFELVRSVQKANLATLLLEAPPELDGPTFGTARTSYELHRRVQQLLAATDWSSASDELKRLHVGYLGLGVGAAAVLHAAAARPQRVRALVVLDGGLELARSDMLERVRTPTLSIISEHAPSQEAIAYLVRYHLRCECAQERLPDVTHPLEGGRTIANTAALACHWFDRYLAQTTGIHRIDA